MTFELDNRQREYFGLEPVDEHWDRTPFSGDTYRPDSILYFDGDRIKRWITSTGDRYSELQYDEATRGRTTLLPKTGKGKPSNLTAAVLEKRQPTGVYVEINTQGHLTIASITTQTTFYSSRWEPPENLVTAPVPEQVRQFIQKSPANHREEIVRFKSARRQNVRFKPGDYFRLKLDRTRFGFGRILLDISRIRKSGLLPDHHGLFDPMGKPVLIQLLAHVSTKPAVEISTLNTLPRLPADLIMDNVLLYGEYEIVGHRDLVEEDFEFPLSYGRCIDARRPGTVFLQWGLIHKELPIRNFDKHLSEVNPLVPEDSGSRLATNPYGYYSIGFQPHYDRLDIIDAAENVGAFDFNRRSHFRKRFDLRNPRNEGIRYEILKAFGLDPSKGYQENSRLSGTTRTTEFLRLL